MNRRTMLEHSATAAVAIAGLRRMPHTLPSLRFGCAAITWEGNDRQAIEDIATLEYRGIQLRASAVEQWSDRPGELADLLAARNLRFAALSSGVLRHDPAFAAEDLELHLRNARFLHQAGGLYLQVIDQRPQGRNPGPEDFKRMGRLLTELGKRTGDLGIQLGYHNHMGALGETPEEIDRILDASDPRWVKLELDTAHYQQGGGVPAAAVRKHGGRLLFLHIKDLETPLPGNGPESYRFVELGQGRVDFPGLFDALEQVGFAGWAIVELDQVPVSTRSPRESAAMSRRYLERLGFTL
jgi:inosose dehydratase